MEAFLKKKNSEFLKNQGQIRNGFRTATAPKVVEIKANNRKSKPIKRMLISESRFFF